MHAKLPPGAPVVVTGRLTLPAAWLLGRLLTRSRNVTCLQPRPQGQECDEFSLTGAQDGQGDKIVASRTSGLPKENDELNGVVVVAISSNVGQTSTATVSQMQDYVRDAMDDSIRAVVWIKLPCLSADNSAPIAAGLFAITRRIHATFPNRSGVALFIYGPMSLAVAAGQAFDPTSFSVVHVPRFASGAFIEAVVANDVPSAPLIHFDTNEHARAALLSSIREEIALLQKQLPTDEGRKALPPFLTDAQKDTLLKQIAEVKVADTEDKSDEFEYDSIRSTLIISRGLLEALVRNVEDKSMQAKIGSLVFVHEAYHVLQGVRSDNHRGIGRAGVVLEEIDFWADVVAVGTLAALEVARRRRKSRKRCASRQIVGWLRAQRHRSV